MLLIRTYRQKASSDPALSDGFSVVKLKHDRQGRQVLKTCSTCVYSIAALFLADVTTPQTCISLVILDLSLPPECQKVEGRAPSMVGLVDGCGLIKLHSFLLSFCWPTGKHQH